MLHVQLFSGKVYHTTKFFRLCKNDLMVYLYEISICRVTAACRRYLPFNPLHLQNKENVRETFDDTYIQGTIYKIRRSVLA